MILAHTHVHNIMYVSSGREGVMAMELVLLFFGRGVTSFES